MRYISAFIVVVFLAGCTAQAAKVGSMTPIVTQPPVTMVEEGKDSVSVGTISGGKETHPLWKSNLGNDGFGGALKNAMKDRGLLAPVPEKAPINVDVQIVKMDEPWIGLTYDVTSHVRYIVTEVSTKAQLFNEEISAVGTATFGDAFFGFERIRLAIENSARANIEAFVDRLQVVLKSRGAPAVPPPQTPKLLEKKTSVPTS